jgi:hypothetical protein
MTRRSRRRGERGIAIMMTALLLIPLMVFAAFGVDLASWYARISQLQKAADAAALAGAVWMPNLGRATTEATASLGSNGIVSGSNGMVVVIEPGSTPTSLRVTVTDSDADRFFSGMFMPGANDLSRFAEAEYNLPLPLGSPLNFFGGDRTKTQSPDVTSHTLVWPTPAGDPARPPVNPTCIVGTADNQGLGRWNAGTPPTFTAGISGSSGFCRWTAARTNATGTTSAPPPDWNTRVPTNSGGTGCKAQSGTTTYGRWVGTTFTSGSSGTSGLPDCTWNNSTTAGLPTDGLTPPYSRRVAPANRPCVVGYAAADGWWPATGAWSTTGAPTNPGQAGYTLCQWSAIVNTVVTTPPNPIAVGRSPGFWAQIHGPGADQQSGDAYSTRCRTTTNCSSPDNSLYIDPSDPNQGYWYVVKAPPGGGQVVMRIFDAQLTPGPLSTGTGDSSITGTADFTTTFRVYRQNNSLDFTARTAVGSPTANTTANSCNWAINGESSFHWAWVDLCTVTMAANDIYLINVRTTTNASTNSAGRNGYALEACLTSSCTTGAQPSIHARERMVLYNNINTGDATFYIAEVAPQYAGKTLVLEMFDPGESSGDAWVYPMMPSTTQPGPVVNASPGQCEFESTRSGYPQAGQTNNGGFCSFQSAASGALYNGHWVTMRIRIPDTYTCTLGTNPVTTPGSCWWGIRYSFSGSGSPTDTTTWRASIEGNPLQLTQ